MSNPQAANSSPASTMSSPRFSLWSRGHSAKSSESSMGSASFQVQARDSLDLFGSQKQLGQVREADNYPSRQICSFDDYRREALTDFAWSQSIVSQPAPAPASYFGHDKGSLSTSSTWRESSSKHLPRSSDGSRTSLAHGLASHFGSLSRRWRNRSSPGPSLSINTSSTMLASPRASLDIHSNQHHHSTTLSSTSHQLYSPSSMHSVAEEYSSDSQIVPFYVEQLPVHAELEEERSLAATPLLPPTMVTSRRSESPLRSPLQSPSIAPANYTAGYMTPVERAPFSYLPSPPLSSQPSMASMPRSHANTAMHDIPSLQQLSDRVDPWATKLGHADYCIHPEPYRPNIIDLDSYKEFRDNWQQARKQYVQHLARTIENHGKNSRVYRLTLEKWDSIDTQWKAHDAGLRSDRGLIVLLQRLSDEPTTPDSPSSLLDRPVSRLDMPELDKSGKFPDLGDADIVGSMSVAAPKVPELERGHRKRSIIKSLSDIFRH